MACVPEERAGHAKEAKEKGTSLNGTGLSSRFDRGKARHAQDSARLNRRHVLSRDHSQQRPAGSLSDKGRLRGIRGVDRARRSPDSDARLGLLRDAQSLSLGFKALRGWRAGQMDAMAFDSARPSLPSTLQIGWSRMAGAL